MVSLIKMRTEIELQECINMHFVFPALLVIGVSFLIISRIIWRMIHGLYRAVKRLFQQTPAKKDLQKEVAELQISEEWAEIKRLMTSIKDQQSGYELKLHANLESFYERLQADIQVRLEEECLRNDQRFGRLHRMVDGFKENFDGVREMLRKHDEFVERMPKFPMTEAWTQTERELLRKRQEGLEKDNSVAEHRQPRSIITVIRTALMEFLKDLKLQMSSQRNEAMSDLKKVFVQMCDDKDDLKNTVETAFSTATHQTQTSFLQFGNVGRDAMKCIAVLSENTERTISTKFQECSDSLKRVIEQLRSVNFNVPYIKQTLDNIDDRFDEIYKKLELGNQKNADHSKEVARSLQATAQEWNEKSSQLDENCKELNRVTHGIKDMLGKLENTLCNGPAGAVNNLPNQNPAVFELEHDNIGVLLTTVQECQEKMFSMKTQIDQNTCGVKQSAELLSDELRFLTNLVKNSVETLKNLAIAMPDSENQQDESFKREHTDIFGDILGFDTISETTEEDQIDKEQENPKLKN